MTFRSYLVKHDLNAQLPFSTLQRMRDVGPQRVSFGCLLQGCDWNLSKLQYTSGNLYALNPVRFNYYALLMWCSFDYFDAIYSIKKTGGTMLLSFQLVSASQK